MKLTVRPLTPDLWLQLTPRDQVPELDRAWRLKRVDDLPVWSLSCFYVRSVCRLR
jgi:hypothetical protein